MMQKVWMTLLVVVVISCGSLAWGRDRPNILVAISDDQSFPHASAYGYEAIRTPAFDQVARRGVLFRNAFTPAPGCSPMRASFLTGRYLWQIEHAGTHASSFAKKYEVYPRRLEDAGYFVGYTGKGWAPGNWKTSGRDRNPAGPVFSKKTMQAPKGIRNTDYAGNFADFLEQRAEGQPFCFWYGGSEPHRSFKKGIGREHGMDPSKVVVPSFLPDTPEIRDDILDYCFEIQWFDQHLGRMLETLRQAGELDNTLVIVTSDNGMAFPRAKANCYEYGIHMPLAISWPAEIPAKRTVDDLVNLIDLTATIYEASGVTPLSENPLAGRSIMNVLRSTEEGTVDASRDAVFSGRERHSSSRYNSLSYPQRCIRTPQYLYIHNFRPERWPAGTPRKYGRGKYAESGEVLASKLGAEHGGYHDIDACPALTILIEGRDEPAISRYFHWAVDRRPAEELFDILADPGCLSNLAGSSDHAQIKQQLHRQLMKKLRQTNDARVVADDGGDVWETYPRYSGLRWFPRPDWAEQHPERVPTQDWLEAKRPRK
jgi:uncharacterized sulfatase